MPSAISFASLYRCRISTTTLSVTEPPIESCDGYEASTSGIYRIGAVGIFIGLIVAWITVQIYRYTVKHNWQIKMPTAPIL